MPSVLRTVAGQDVTAGLLRTPPHNPEAERALLGAILMNNSSYERVSDFLLPQHFTDPINALIYESIVSLIESGGKVDPITMRSYLERSDLYTAAGGMKYLAGLTKSMVTVINAGDYGKLIYDLYLRREVIAIAEDALNAAFDVTIDEPAGKLIEGVEQALFDLTDQSAARESTAKTASAAGDEAVEKAQTAYKNDGKLAGLSSGLRDLNTRTGGFHPTDLTILAGRPSMGKTALATTIAYNAARYFQTTDNERDRGKWVAFYSLEMSSDQLMTRILSERGRVDSHKIRTGRATGEEVERFIKAKSEIDELPLMIDDAGAPSISTIRTRSRRLARQKRTPHHSGLGLIIVDYLQLIAPTKDRRDENRVQEISSITRGLKALAKSLKVPVIALSQLNRGLEQREDKRPQLSDLRESGTIEQDADVVVFVYRDQYYLERADPKRKPEESDETFLDRHGKWMKLCEDAHGIAELIVAKQRHGPVGIERVRFDGPRTWFEDLEVRHVDSGHPLGHPAAENPPTPEEAQKRFEL